MEEEAEAIPTLPVEPTGSVRTPIGSIMTPSPKAKSPVNSIRSQSASIRSQPPSHKSSLRQSPQRAVSPNKVSDNTSVRSKQDSIKSKQDSIKAASLNIIKPEKIEENISYAMSKLLPQGESISDHVDELTQSVQQLTNNMDRAQSPEVGCDLKKIANMSKVLTNEANALRKSIKSLTENIENCQNAWGNGEDVNFPYHLFLIEMIVNRIHMKCDCFDLNSNNLVISATFLGKQPIVLYDASYGKIDNFNKLNVGKSTLFAMTYDKICSIETFEILLQLTKEPPCSTCVTKLAESYMDFTQEFLTLREELCKKWIEEKPKDNIICTTSTPLSKSMFYLSCGDKCSDSIGIIEMSVRMSFLGKEINTAFCSNTNKPKDVDAPTSLLCKEDNGMTMYKCQKVEMDDEGKVLLDEDEFMRKPSSQQYYRGHKAPASEGYSSKGYSSPHPAQYYDGKPNYEGGVPKYDEIFTKVNTNELTIKVPKPSRVERMPRYEKMQELCTCEPNPYNTGEQIQFELPKELCYPDKTHNEFASNLKYTYKGCDKTCESKERKIVNVTPTNCPISAVNMEKEIHPHKDVFILKIGKKTETKDKKTDLEIQLCTPKVPQDTKQSNVSAQCSSSTVKLKKKVKKGKGKDKASKGKRKLKGKASKTKTKKKK